MNEVTNNIPYLISEFVKADKLLIAIEAEYKDQYKSHRYRKLYATYKSRKTRYENSLNSIGRHGTIIEVKAKEQVNTKSMGTRYIDQKPISLYFTNVSVKDVEMILKRDYKDLHDILIGELTPGKTYLELKSHS